MSVMYIFHIRPTLADTVKFHDQVIFILMGFHPRVSLIF